MDQLPIAALPPDKRLICLALIDAIDEAGYLRADLAEVAERLVHRCRDGRRNASGACRASIRSASARAISPNAWRCS